MHFVSTHLLLIVFLEIEIFQPFWTFGVLIVATPLVPLLRGKPPLRPCPSKRIYRLIRFSQANAIRKRNVQNQKVSLFLGPFSQKLAFLFRNPFLSLIPFLLPIYSLFCFLVFFCEKVYSFLFLY